MTIIRSRRNVLGRDKRLSHGAKGLALALLAQRSVASFDARKIAETSPDLGRRRTRKYLIELEETGYLRRRVVHTSRGRLITQTILCEDPDAPDPFETLDANSTENYQVAPKPRGGASGSTDAAARAGNPPTTTKTKPGKTASTALPGTQTRASVRERARVLRAPSARRQLRFGCPTSVAAPGISLAEAAVPQPRTSTVEAPPPPPPPRPLPDLPEPRVHAEHVARAAEALIELRVGAPRLTLSETEVTRLAHYGAKWFARGISETRFGYALSAGLPERIGDPAALIEYRLVHKLPPIRPGGLPTTDAGAEDLPRATPLPIFRVTHCPTCNRDVPPQALDDGRCFDCRAGAYEATHRRGAELARAALAEALGAVIEDRPGRDDETSSPTPARSGDRGWPAAPEE